MFHPLQPSKIFSNSEFVQEIAQSACVATSLGSGVTFYLSQKVASIVSFISPFAYLSFLPSELVYKISGNNGNTFHKMSWLAPVSGITIASLTAYKFYAMSNSFLIKGLICGTHSTAMMIFAYAPPSASMLGLITLKDNLKSLIWNLDRFSHLGREKLSLIDAGAETAASVAFLTSSISLTLILQNPILANTVAYPLAALVKIVAMRGLGELAIR